MTQATDFPFNLVRRARSEGREAHNRALTLVEDLTEEQLHWRPGVHAPSIAFHLWHLARWADYDVHQVDGTAQIWQAKGYSAAWGFPTQLGEADAGTEMGDEASESLVLPEKAALLEYARAAFAAVDEMLDRIGRDALAGSPPAVQTAAEKILGHPGEDKLLGLFLTYLTHDNRHLGMIEALRGILGLQGSATN